ncbi:hypothetical protein PMZ80_003059 [Knufia obscura]|uniref:Phenazine biosynthesis protein n=2 Tax=Knufia TaxID=430999 RepID=A0AAN8ECV6_9EURO|nr:hypothetical protein PMZ80_003059 [Knufia obscura]KAK5952353.1 hypothetical protein OHC33_006396 [Knufia fluminis]
MTQRLNYNTLDVFTTKLFTGNQLGLIHVSTGTTLTQEQKQRIAKEFNYSESVFLYERRADSAPATYDAQIFLPTAEIPFAGHPTIGTAVWIFENLEKNRDEITINLKAGPVPIKYDRALGTATAAIPHNVRVHSEQIPWNRVVECQPGLASATTPLSGSSIPLVSIVSGVNFALVDLTAQPDLLANVVITKDDIAKAEDLDEGWQDGLLGNVSYYIKPDQGDGIIRIRKRMMAINLEDPATGAACSALAAYLALQKGGKGERYKFEIEQGVEMGRPSMIFVDVVLKEDGKSVEMVELKGQAVEVMSGSIRIC